ncbi:hypothetical protein AB1L05_09570 [Cytobacillus horneckiae]|uniref:Uncharacterized protein n=1 Tax=Cytobacillus horneckiae TaxID=549687 RepID=A0A2N0Z8S7_9BACI|nr:hypothetical protein [Cytobacillus horneckiae]MEC1156761.1 hypothetical protein [Cytobacillus horneckiae]MED2940521.1 hypothetical protein [Cytobacillus horneckiae]PKG25923.1 hypothetical protein CWS20_26470 [Cytobacillus horneckiae]
MRKFKQLAIILLCCFSILLFGSSVSIEASDFNGEINETIVVPGEQLEEGTSDQLCWYCTKFRYSGYFKVCIEGFWSPHCIIQ